MIADWGPTISMLVVEDDRATAELVRALLNKEPGWGATVVYDAAAAREVFKHVQVELLVLSHRLPGISGLELLALLREDPHWNDPPVVLLASEEHRPEVEAAIEAGHAAQFVLKPFDVDSLIQAVTTALATHEPRRAATTESELGGAEVGPAHPHPAGGRGPAQAAETARDGLRLLEFPAGGRQSG